MSLKEQTPLREQAKTLLDRVDEILWNTDAREELVFLRREYAEEKDENLTKDAQKLKRQLNEELISLKVAEDMLNLVRSEAAIAIERTHTERMKELEQEADLNGYSRGRANAEVDKKTLVNDNWALKIANNKLRDDLQFGIELIDKQDKLMKRQGEKLEAVRKLLQDLPSPETLITHEEDQTEEIAQEFYEKLEVDCWIKKLKELLGEASSGNSEKEGSGEPVDPDSLQHLDELDTNWVDAWKKGLKNEMP